MAEKKPFRSGRVALVGKPNVGKSTLLNVLLGENISIVSPHPQTTRQRLLGIVRTAGAEIGFIDTPGLHEPRHRLGVRMQNEAKEALRGAELVVLVADARDRPDKTLLGELPRGALLALNKVDLVQPKSRLLPALEAWNAAHEFAAIVPISAKTESGTQRLLQEVVERLPEREGPPLFDDDAVTDKPVRFLVAETVREQILLRTRQEVPHGIAVTVESFEENEKRGDRVKLTVHVTKESHKKIVVGRGGSLLKDAGTAARQKLEKLLGRRVHLSIWVRVTPDWVDDPRALGDMGFEP